MAEKTLSSPASDPSCLVYAEERLLECAEDGKALKELLEPSKQSEII